MLGTTKVVAVAGDNVPPFTGEEFSGLALPLIEATTRYASTPFWGRLDLYLDCNLALVQGRARLLGQTFLRIGWSAKSLSRSSLSGQKWSP